jgi:uncharacterized damage-inducible protein DinB
MSEVQRILQQLDRAFEKDSWHGPAVLELLEDVNAGRAAARSIPDAHSIWELVLHMATWKDVVRRRILGERPDVTEEWDWPPVRDTTEPAWRTAIGSLRSAHAALREVAARLTDELLDQSIGQGGSSAYVQLHGVVQHDLYHAGQIALLKKV